MDPLPIDYFNLKISKGNNLDLSKMMGLGDYLSEESYFQPNNYKACNSKKLPVGDHAPMDTHGRAPVAYECPQKKLKIILFGDSFMQHMVPYLREYARRLVVIYGNPSMTTLKKVVDNEHPDLVLEESVSRLLFKDWLAEIPSR